MKQIFDSLYASVLFLILILLGELLQFLPDGSAGALTLFYALGMLVIGSIVAYRRAETVELMDFIVAALILGVQALWLGGRLSTDEWFYLAFATFSSTISFGCNRRFMNRIHLQNNSVTKPGND